MNRPVSRTSNKIGVFYRHRKLRTVEGSIIRKVTIALWLPACLTLIGCPLHSPTSTVTPAPGQSPTSSSVHSVTQGESPIPCKGGGSSGPLGPSSDGIQLMQVCGNCDAGSGYPTSANQYGWWCTNNFDEAVKMLGFTQKCKVTRVASQQECCNPSQ